jgi:N-acetylated-alpha-linked acidic dipeptidase
MLRLANAEVLPFEFSAIAESISQYVDDLKDLSNKMREETDERNLRIKNKEYELYFDLRKNFVTPTSQDPVPYLNFAPLENAAAKLEKSAANFKRVSAEKANSDSIQKLNEILMLSERALTRKEGLPGRPWWQHQIYAPGVYTGYAAKPLPSISEAIDQRKWKLAEEQIVVVADTLEKFSAEIDRATETLK